jgi:hypothetical protein
MPDRLERSLRDLGATLDYPPTPDFASTIAAELRTREVRHRPSPVPPRRLRRTLVLAALTLLVTAASVLAASPGTRDAVLEFFGLRGATVEEVPRLPEVPGGDREPRALGGRMSLEEGRARVDFSIVTGPGRPPRTVRVSEAVEGGVVTFEQHGLLVTQFRGSTAREYLGKLTAEGTEVERLRIDGRRAIWLEGRPHVVFLRDSNGRVVEQSLREAGDVLLVEREGLLVRIEGAASRAAAVSFARRMG